VKTIVPILLVLLVVGGLAAIKANQIGALKSAAEAGAKAGPPPETVASAPAQKATWEYTLEAVGSVEAGKGVTISNDEPGIVTRLSFESGDEVKAGALLLELDTSVERAQLSSSSARLDLAKTTLERTRALVKERVGTVAELDTARANVDTSKAEVAALRAQIARKIVRAPFAGKLGIRSVNIGQYLSPGTPITTLQSNTATYVDFSLPQQHLEELRVGLPVKMSMKDARIELTGRVAAIEPEVNEVTRSVKVRASVEDAKQQLRPGMFVNVSVLLDQKRELIMVPVTAVVVAPYGDSVFVLEDAQGQPGGATIKVARQQFVQLGETRGDFVEVEKGLSGDELLVAAGAFKLRNGAPVVVNNEVEPQPKLHPTPPDR
jgi:membrane fusion protein, multidrug efflux system